MKNKRNKPPMDTFHLAYRDADGNVEVWQHAACARMEMVLNGDGSSDVIIRGMVGMALRDTFEGPLPEILLPRQEEARDAIRDEQTMIDDAERVRTGTYWDE